ncbi:MAG: NADPH-dependent FMN reductase, partial [Salibacteraceae bacterium]
GSNSSTSINQQLVKYMASIVKDAEVEVLDLRDFEAPIFSTDLEAEIGAPESMKVLFEKMSSADGFIVSTPEHNGYMPAVLKNTIDWLSRMGRKVFNGKPVVFTSASPGGRGGATALGQMLVVMPHQGATIIGSHSIGSFFDKFKDGALVDREDKLAIQKIITDLEDSL